MNIRRPLSLLLAVSLTFTQTVENYKVGGRGGQTGQVN